MISEEKKKMKAKRVAFISISVALAMVLSFLESLIPPLAAVPGIKPGLANSVTLFLLYRLGAPVAILVSLVRVFLSSLLFGSVVSLWYSLAGACLSFAVMLLLKKTDKFSTVGVSVAGAVMHNAAQITVAALLMETAEIISYLPVLTVTGVITGIIVGVIAGLVSARIKKI